VAGRQARQPLRRRPPNPPGRHYLKGRHAADLVRLAHPEAGDLIFDLGAGTGTITAGLAASGARVFAVERDGAAVARLRRRFADLPNVTVTAADLRSVPLPRRRFAVVANPPFGTTTALLTRLLDPQRSRLAEAHLVLQWGAAVGLVRPDRSRTRRWAARWDISIVRRIPATGFVPAPSVDAAVVVIRPR
jgi:23S rRNA (adenine-N6)-dimethyltransferase